MINILEVIHDELVTRGVDPSILGLQLMAKNQHNQSWPPGQIALWWVHDNKIVRGCIEFVGLTTLRLALPTSHAIEFRVGLDDPTQSLDELLDMVIQFYERAQNALGASAR